MSIYTEGVPPEVRRIAREHPGLEDYERERLLTHTMLGLIDDAFDLTYQWNPWEYVVAIARALEAGTVEARIVALPPPIDNWSVFSGSDEHRRVCGSVAAWLDSLGREWTFRRLRVGNGRVDVMTRDQTLAAEVGHTKSGKVVDCLESDMEVLMVPWITCGLFGILLTPHLKEKGIDTLTPELQERCKQLTQSRHTPYVPRSLRRGPELQPPPKPTEEVLVRRKKQAEARRQKRVREKAAHPELYCPVEGCFHRPSRCRLYEGLCFSCGEARMEAELV